MKKKHLKLFFICMFSLFFLNLKGQDINGKIVYKIRNELKLKIDTIKNDILKNVLHKILSSSKDIDAISFELLFNRERSYFHYIKTLSADENEINILKIGAEARGEIFTEFKPKITLTYMDSEPPLIKDSLSQYKWKLVKEKKMIGKFLCFKALGQQIIYREPPSKQKVLKLVAWYCPGISVPTGPAGYGGLPGLILELTEVGVLHFYSHAIKLNLKDDIKIKKVPKCRIISRNAYNDRMRKNYNN